MIILILKMIWDALMAISKIVLIILMLEMNLTIAYIVQIIFMEITIFQKIIPLVKM